MIRILIAIIALHLFGLRCEAQINQVAVDSIVQIAAGDDLFEGTVLIAEEGNIVYHKSFGFVDNDKIIPLENSTSFSIASITKMVTAIVTLQLVEEGKFQLTDNLKTLLPDLEISESNKITVHHLLLHISGLPNEDDRIYSQSKSPGAFVDETLGNQSNSIGEFNYANIDYVLLGLIIEKYDKTTWMNSVRNRILDKASMKQTGFLKRGDYPESFAYSFSYNDENVRQADPMLFIENYYAAGCMHSTAEDLLKLDQLMYGDTLLSQASKEVMFTSYPEYNYSGYSVWTYNYPFAESMPKVMERRGGILGANSVLVRMLESNRTIIILSNNNKFNPDSFGNKESLKEALMIELGKASR
jgi:CubicO group peptidase (beta-lactamase class C family)